MRKDLTWHDEIEQGTPEWFELRAGMVTGSVASPLAADCKKGYGGLSIGAWSLVDKLAAQLTAPREMEHDSEFKNHWMDRGHEYENEAADAYSEATFRATHKVGFVSWNNRLAGFSPDRMVDEERGLEIKCLALKNHFKWIRLRKQGGKRFKLDSEKYRQVNWCMYVAGLSRWDITHFHPEAGKLSLDIYTVERDEQLMDIFDEKLPLIEAAIKQTVLDCGVVVPQKIHLLT